MSTPKAKSPLEQALSGLPTLFRSKLVASYIALKSATAEMRYDSAGLNAGKFCEIAIRLLQQVVLGTYIPFGTKISNFADECRKIITASAPKVPESLRVLVPRALVFVYSVRNKRGVGHVGGDVDANSIDAATMARVTDWVVCELIRVFHALSLEEAQDLVDSISVRQIPSVWEVGGKKRVLVKGLTAKKKTLLLLYSEPSSAVLAEDLCSWVEYSTLALFRRDVLRPLHADRLIEFDDKVNTVHLSPTGSAEVEQNILKTGAAG